jgi:RNA polymerase sigma factor (sigma-70 family)
VTKKRNKMKLAQISAELVERARNRDRQALFSIVDSLRRPLYNLALRMVATPEDAEDATQEALLKIVDSMGQFEGRSRFSTWAWSVATRSILDFRRGRYRHPLYSVEDFQADLLNGLESEAAERPDDRVLLGQLKVACSRALLQTLDADSRLAFILGEILELDSQEAAAIAGVSEVAFRKRLSRARDTLYPALRSHCGVVDGKAACRCHRRLARAKQLGRVGHDQPQSSVDVAALRAVLAEIQDVAERGALYYRSHPDQPPPPLRDRLYATLAAP